MLDQQLHCARHSVQAKSTSFIVESFFTQLSGMLFDIALSGVHAALYSLLTVIQNVFSLSNRHNRGSRTLHGLPSIHNYYTALGF